MKSTTSSCRGRSGFNSFERAAVLECLDNNAVVISGALSPESVLALRRPPKVPSLLTHKNWAPELKGLFDLFAIEDIDQPGLVRIGDIVEVTGFQGIIRSHTDDGVKFGISALVPTDGLDACFLADNSPFNKFGMASFADEYGMGDVLLLRQSIQSVEGESCKLAASSHVGLSLETRRLLTIDLEFPNIVFAR